MGHSFLEKLKEERDSLDLNVLSTAYGQLSHPVWNAVFHKNQAAPRCTSLTDQKVVCSEARELDLLWIRNQCLLYQCPAGSLTWREGLHQVLCQALQEAAKQLVKLLPVIGVLSVQPNGKRQLIYCIGESACRVAGNDGP
ncbi:hypothetical protein E2C01_063391 [Portunus trituberculatus]|uniref:Uncharacterized protein n=1 Tax=Portunus trituberculatus TaxID=210409 RepID=A0A5B7HIU0_PORTR|nr:hypothetical protein [Portunus trituberculatus]